MAASGGTRAHLRIGPPPKAAESHPQLISTTPSETRLWKSHNFHPAFCQQVPQFAGPSSPSPPSTQVSLPSLFQGDSPLPPLWVMRPQASGLWPQRAGLPGAPHVQMHTWHPGLACPAANLPCGCCHPPLPCEPLCAPGGCQLKNRHSALSCPEQLSVYSSAFLKEKHPF